MKKNLSALVCICGLLALGASILTGCSQGEQTDPKDVEKTNAELKDIPPGEGEDPVMGGGAGGKKGAAGP